MRSVWRKTACFLALSFCVAGASPRAWALVVDFNNALEEEEIIFVTSEKEKAMGRNIDKKVRDQFDMPVDPLMQERIEGIGRRLAAGSDRKDMVYRFTVLEHEEDDFYNAFAAPKILLRTAVGR